MVLTPDAADFLRLLEADAEVTAGWSFEQIRERARAVALAADDRIGLDDVRDVDAAGVPCRLYRPRIGAPVALYVHGGGWVLHDLETHDAFCRELAHRTGWALLAVDYRRAPEHPHPAPLDDVETAARWLREEGRGLRLATEMVAGIGDSTGANLLAGLTVRDPGLLDALVLMYPPVDAAAAFVDEDNAALDTAGMRAFWDAYAPGSAGENPEVSPLRADLSSFPPTLVVTAEHDILRDQGEAFAAALAAAGRCHCLARARCDARLLAPAHGPRLVAGGRRHGRRVPVTAAGLANWQTARMRVHLGSDHAGFELKSHLITWLTAHGYEPVDHGAAEYDADDDYPPFCIAAARAAVDEPGSLAVVIGGSGNGEQMAANKVKGARAALAWSPETAALAREHNNAQVVAVGARMHSTDEATAIVETFLTTAWSRADRHQRRIDMVLAYEETGELA